MPEKIFKKSRRNMTKRSRIFMAIMLKDEVKEEVAKTVKKLEEKSDKAFWLDPTKAHIDIIYLGHIAQERVQAARDALKKTAESFAPFTVSTGLLDYIYTGASSDESVIVISIKDPEKTLREFYKILSDNLAQEEFYPPNRLQPHITLGRLKKVRDRNQQTQVLEKLISEELKEQTIEVDQVGLYEILPPEQSQRYRILGNAQLGRSL